MMMQDSWGLPWEEEQSTNIKKGEHVQCLAPRHYTNSSSDTRESN